MTPDSGWLKIEPVKYEIVSRAILPVRMKGLFTFAEAHQICCDWNIWHLGEDMAFPVKRETGTYLEHL